MFQFLAKTVTVVGVVVKLCSHSLALKAVVVEVTLMRRHSIVVRANHKKRRSDHVLDLTDG
jgi:hypothetical protein